jgi:hypothetical protein
MILLLSRINQPPVVSDWPQQSEIVLASGKNMNSRVDSVIVFSGLFN